MNFTDSRRGKKQEETEGKERQRGGKVPVPQDTKIHKHTVAVNPQRGEAAVREGKGQVREIPTEI